MATNTTNSKKTNTNNGKTKNNRSRTTATNRTRKNKQNEDKKPLVDESVKEEVSLLLILAFSIILLISNFGLAGFLGEFVSKVGFGMMGAMNYIFPVFILVIVGYIYIHRKNTYIYIKLIAAVVLFNSLCSLVQIIMEPVNTQAKLLSYFVISSEERTGGGLVSGFTMKILCPLIGVVGTVILLIVFCIAACVVLSEKSFIQSIKDQGKRAKQDMDQLKFKRESLEEEYEYEDNYLVAQQPTKKSRTDRRTRSNTPVRGVSFDTTLSREESTQDFLKAGALSYEEQIAIQDEPYPVSQQEPIGGEVTGDTPPLFDPKDETHVAVEKASKEPRKSRQHHESKEELEKVTETITQDIQKGAEHDDQYVFPPLDLLSKGRTVSANGEREMRDTAIKLQQTLQSFGVSVDVTNYSKGPSVTRYELQPQKGVKVSRIVGLADDIKLNLAAADIRIEAPIPGKAAVGIEVPNKENATVALRNLLESQAFTRHESKLAFAAGKDLSGQTVVTDIAKMPHVLIAGSTGSGKSVCINTIIMSILYKANPEDVKLIMIDPKVVELSVYNGIPHLLIPVVTDPKKAAGALHWAVAEMTKRYQLFADYGVRDLKGYNEKVKAIEHIEDENKPTKMPQIVVIVDELADLMMVAPSDVEEAICRLAQLARAAGIHLILATQRPSVNVITGLIKANMPSRIAFAVSSGVDSRTIIDMNGAEKLLGKGDMLFYPSGYPKPARVQGAFVSDQEVQKVVQFLIDQQGETKYSEEIQREVTSSASAVGAPAASGSGNGDEVDSYFADAGRFIIEKDKASIGMLQRMFKIGFNRAARIMDQLCEAGVVGEEEGTKPRKILMTMEEFNQYIEEYI